MLNHTAIGTLKEHSARQRLVLPSRPDEASVISILKCIPISITEMCDQFDFNFDCLEYFNFNFNLAACISIISIVETRFFGHLH